MSAPARVSIDQLKEALRQTGGNVTHAAALCGMARNNLRERFAVAGIDINTFRARDGILSIRKPAPVRVGVAHEAMLQDARFDLQYLMRQELTASDVLKMLLDEELPGWIKRKLEALQQSAGRRA